MEDEKVCRKRIYRVEPPEELTSSKFFTPWQPERLSLKQGVQETAVPLLIGYVLITIGSIVLCTASFSHLPSIVTLPTFFGYDSVDMSSLVLITGMVTMQIYLIYRDLIRRSMAKTLFLVPLIYFFAELAILFSLQS